MKKSFLLILFTLFFIQSFSLFAQIDPCVRISEGREFWVGFMDHDGTSGIETKLYVTSRVATTGTVTLNGAPIATINVAANGSQQIDLSPASNYLVNNSQIPQNKGVFVTTDDPVSLYALNRKRNSADAALIFPLEALGTEYYTMSYTPSSTTQPYSSVFLIVATEDDTNITITPSQRTTAGNPLGVPINITLQEGQTYLVRSQGTFGANSDLTGSSISSDKPIAVFSGNVRVHVDGSSSDHAYEQMPSINTWGRNFVTVPSVRSNPAVTRSYDYFRIIAQTDGTEVTISGEPAVITLNAGEYHTFSTQGNNTPRVINATERIMVGQFTISDQFGGGEDADPYFIVLSPNQQTLKDINLEAISTAQISTFHVDVITKTTNTANILLDGTPMTFTAIAGSDMSFARRNVAPGTYNLNNSDPANDGFIAYVYGYGNYESYGYLAGSSLETVVDVADDIAFCDGAITEDTLEAPDGFIRYEWRLIPDPTIISTAQDITVTVSGLYELTTENEDGCVKFDTTEVIFSPPSIADIKYQGISAEELRFCDSLGQQVISGFDVSHTTDNTYKWRIIGDPTVISTDVNLVVDNFSATTLYELEVINAATQCSSAGNGSTFDTITVIFEPTHDLDIVFDGTTPDVITFCDSEGEQTIRASLDPLPSDVTYRWFKDGIFLPSETSNTLIVNEFSATTRYRVEALRPDQTLSCVQTDEIVVTFYPVALIQHDGVVSDDELLFCDIDGAKTISTGVVTNPNVEYLWRDITDPANPIDLGTDFELVVDNFSSTRIYEITITDLENGTTNPCALTDEVTVTFFGAEIREIGQTDEPDEMTFCAEDGERGLEVTVEPSLLPFSEIKWFERNGTALTQVGTGVSLLVNEFQPNVTVTKTYVVQITNPRLDCTIEDEIIVNFLPPLGVGLLGSTDICEGNQTPVTFRLSGSFPMTLTYRSNPLIGSTTTQQIVVGTATTTSPFDYIIQSEGGMYEIVALENDLCVLTDIPTTVVEVTVTPTPEVTISSPDTVICADGTTKFIADGATSYVFYKNGLPMPAGGVANEYEPVAGTFQNGDQVWV
ncbi:IgGFc-binding protein, partial [Bernardetia sp.]|uniref:IgGFc-binding protein n=1 Tax=Bernardetia sp. TaxID=1937974 RepID=UPI0025C51768